MKSAYRKYLAKKLSQKRNESNLSQDEVAQKINKTRYAYAAYEEGRAEPSLFTLELLCMLYNTTLDSFLYDSPAKIAKNF